MDAGQPTSDSPAGFIVQEIDGVRPHSPLEHEVFVSVGHKRHRKTHVRLTEENPAEVRGQVLGGGTPLFLPVLHES